MGVTGAAASGFDAPGGSTAGAGFGFGEGGFVGGDPEGLGPGPGSQTSTSGIDPGAVTTPGGAVDWGTAAAQSPGMLDPSDLAAIEAQYGGSIIGHSPSNEAIQAGIDAVGTGKAFDVVDALGGGAAPGVGFGGGAVSGDGGGPLGLGPLAFGTGGLLGPGPPGVEAGITLEDGTVVPSEVVNRLAAAGITEPDAIRAALSQLMHGGDFGGDFGTLIERLTGGSIPGQIGGGGFGLPGDWQQDGTPVQAGGDTGPILGFPIGGGGVGLPGDWRQDGTPIQAGGGLDIDPVGGIINGPQDLPPQFGQFQQWMRGRTLGEILAALDMGRVA